MAWLVPTIQNLVNSFLSSIEGLIGQGTPLSNKAYNRVIAGAQGMIAGGLYRYAADRAKAVLAQTAQGTDLDLLGAEYGVTRNMATSAVVLANLPATDGTILNLATNFQGPNGLTYQSLSTQTAPSDGISGHGINILLACLTPGTQGNVGINSLMNLLQTLAGATSPATVTSITATGCVTAIDTELDPAYAQRILTVEQAYGGGGNAADYRTWAQAVAGVANAYPYAGLPYYGALNAANAYSAQVISIQNAPTGGTFTLTYNGQTTGTISWNPTAAQIATALQALTGAAAVTVSALAYNGQFVLVTGSPTGGTFVLGYNAQTTSALAYNATAAQIQTAMQALTGAAACTVTLQANGSFLIQNLSTYSPITLNTNSLTGGTSPSVAITISPLNFLVTGFTVFGPLALGTNSLTGGTSPTVYIVPNSPPARTVYVECLSSIQASGIAPQSLITQVRAEIQYNLAGIANQPLGLTMDSLYVLPIIRTGFYVTITTLSVPSGQTGTVQAAILTAVTSFFLTMRPYVDGVDPPFTRNDLVTQPNLSSAIQAVLQSYGASCVGVGFGTAAGAFLSTYQLGQGEKASLVSVTYQ